MRLTDSKACDSMHIERKGRKLKNNKEEIIEKKVRRIKTISVIMVIIITLVFSAIIISIYYSMNQCLNNGSENIMGTGELKFSLLINPIKITASDRNTSLVLIFTLKNVGNNNVRIIPPMMHFTIIVNITNSKGNRITANFGDPIYGNIYNKDTIILYSPKWCNYLNTSIAEDWYIYMPLQGEIYNNPDNYTFKAMYTTHFFDNDSNGKKLNKITLEYWHGSVESNSVVVTAY